MYSTRSKEKSQQLLQSLKNDKTEHRGHDVSTSVKKAMDSGGSLDDEPRKKMKGEIARNKLIGPSLEKLLPKSFVSHITEHMKSGEVVSQVDKRVDPRSGKPYEGYMLSSTRVSPDPFDSKDKEIGEPMSPNPYSGEGIYHRTHTTPFGLGGIKTNDTRTVNAYSWANITVDGFIEDKAKKASGKYGEGNVFHFRFDTHDRSTVGYLVDRGDVKGDDRRWKVVHAQYQRIDTRKDE